MNICTDYSKHTDTSQTREETVSATHNTPQADVVYTSQSIIVKTLDCVSRVVNNFSCCRFTEGHSPNVSGNVHLVS